MLELLIHGTKFGWRILYKTPNFPSSFASDLRRDDVNNDRITVGKHAYSISHVSDGCIFSKYICVWDAERRAIGNLSFSIFMQKDNNLNSEDIIRLLDELTALYWSEYVTSGELSNKQENWLMFETIIKKYENKIQNLPYDDIEVSLVGSGDAAFIYYKDENQLLQYIESPHQKEYQYHKQVFLVSNSLNGFVENPLNVLRHNLKANLTGQIDLNNHKYRLIIPLLSESNIKIEVRSNDKTIFNNGFLRIRSEIEITWTKPFHVSQRCTGNISELSSSFLTFDDLNRTIKIKEIYLNAKKYTFRFKPVNEYKKPISDCEVVLKCDKFNNDRKASNNEITLTEEEVSIGVNVYVKRHGFEYPILQLKPQMEGNTILLGIPENNFRRVEPGKPSGNIKWWQEVSKPAMIIVGLLIFITVIGFSLILFNDDEPSITEIKLADITNDSILSKNQLQDYRETLKCGVKPEENIFEKIKLFISLNDDDNDDGNVICEKINSYIAIYDSLKGGNNERLNELDYLKLKYRIDTIDIRKLDSSIINKINNYIENSDNVNLDILFKFITTSPENKNEESSNKSKQTKELSPAVVKQEEGISKKQGNKVNSQTEDVETLKNLFWQKVRSEIDNPRKETFDEVLNRYKTYKINDPIRIYLDTICFSTANFRVKFKKIPKENRSKAAEDKDLDLLKTSTLQ
jgi:hypothetical protein